MLRGEPSQRSSRSRSRLLPLLCVPCTPSITWVFATCGCTAAVEGCPSTSPCENTTRPAWNRLLATATWVHRILLRQGRSHFVDIPHEEEPSLTNFELLCLFICAVAVAAPFTAVLSSLTYFSKTVFKDPRIFLYLTIAVYGPTVLISVTLAAASLHKSCL